MKTAVVYYSMSGTCEKLARLMEKQMNSDLIQLVPKKAYPDKGFKKYYWGGKSAVMAEKPELEAYEFDAGSYDLIVFGTPVWASTFAPPLRTFIEENREMLSTKKIAAYACYKGSGGEKTLRKLREELGIDRFIQEAAFLETDVTKKAEALVNEFCEELKTDNE